MTSYRTGELLLMWVPYTSGWGVKKRPVLVLLDAGDADVTVARVTTQPAATPHDVPLLGWHASGLLAPSVVRAHKVVTLEKRLVIRPLGMIDPVDRPQVAAVLNRLFGAW